MPRPLRITQPNTVYHLISRFVAREWFMNSEWHRRMYLRLLQRGLGFTDWRCFGYALMSSHIHLALRSGEMPLADWLREVHTPFAECINEERRRIGAVFARGPNLHEVREDGVARLISYIHRNPVRAGVVRGPSDSDWTSHRAYVGSAAAPPWLDVELGARLAGYRDPKELAAWIDSVDVNRDDLEAVTVRPADPIDEDAELEDIRELEEADDDCDPPAAVVLELAAP